MPKTIKIASKLSLLEIKSYRDQVDRRRQSKEEQVLKRLGGFYKRVVERSMRRRKSGKNEKPSKPGDPPFARTGLLRKGIRFEVKDDTVTIGAIKLNGTAYRGQIPRLLEEGGRASGTRRIVETKTGSGRRRKKPTVRFEPITYTMKPRPFVGERSINFPKAIDALKKERVNLL